MIRLFPRTVLVLLLSCCTSGCGLLEKIRPPELPENSAVDRVVWLDQGWSDEERFWFHHTSQGTATLPMPYRWFVALEQPSLSLFGDPGLLSDEEYLRRIGFIPSPRGEGSRAWPASNPDGLPVGFARMSGVTDPVTGEPLDRIGFTCAACHTGHLEYDGASIRIDGGPAMTDLGAFRKAMRLALFYTKYVPFRFGRFAERVLGDERTDEQTKELESQLDELIARGRAWAKLSNPHVEEHDDTVVEGFTRLDALNRIGNQLFGQDLYVPDAENDLVAANLAPLTAPVNYPHIWATSWFDWVQYDGSIMQPMIRNAGEALGVSARVNLLRPGDDLFASTVAVEKIFALEQLLAGDPPRRSNGSGGGASSGARHGFSGLQAPPWPEEILGRIDREQAEAGRALYASLCQKCHRPAPDSEEFWSDRYWTDPADNEARRSYLRVPTIPADKIGTDSGQEEVLIGRQVRLPDWLAVDPSTLGCSGDIAPGAVTETAFAFALGVVTAKVADHYYRTRRISESRRRELDGYRDNCLRAGAGYKARPLDGIWATAPYLHNGSVPTLYDLLLPADERPEEFWLGSRVFDPKRVGYESVERPGLFELDTEESGNSNAGHEFGEDGIGRPLTDDERWALVEYLKTL